VQNLLKITKMFHRLIRRLSDSAENATASKLLIILLSSILGCGIAYYLLGFFDAGIIPTTTDKTTATLLDCLYFSCVTISSLGYGDFRPASWSRLVAVLQVLFGLGIIAVLIARIASDRQGRLIRLTYRAEQQRKFRRFHQICDEIIESLTDTPPDYKYISDHIVQAKRLVQNIRNFCSFEVPQADLACTENGGFIVGMQRDLIRLLRVQNGLASYATTKFLKDAVKHTIKMTEQIVSFFDDSNNINGLEEVQQDVRNEIQLQRERLRDMPREKVELTDKLIQEIADRMPPDPWPVGIHRTIAKDMGIPNTIVYEAISVIRMQNQPLEQSDGD